MKWNKIITLYSALMMVLLCWACSDDDSLKFDTDNAVGFTTAALQASGAETDALTIELLTNGFESGSATIAIHPLSGWTYGAEFVTVPAAANSEFTVDIVDGKGSFTFRNIKGAFEGEQYFSISVVGANNFVVAEGVSSTMVLEISNSQREDFNDCDAGIPTGWTVFSAASAAEFVCSGSGRGASGNADDFAMEMNNYQSDAAAKDWLITPALLIGATSTMEFNSLLRYSGSDVKVMVSTDYIGSGDPASATWTEFTAATNALDLDENSWDFVASGAIDMSAHAGVVYVGFYYTSIGAASGESGTFRLDDFVIK